MFARGISARWWVWQTNKWSRPKLKTSGETKRGGARSPDPPSLRRLHSPGFSRRLQPSFKERRFLDELLEQRSHSWRSNSCLELQEESFDMVLTDPLPGFLLGPLGKRLGHNCGR